MGEKKYAVRDEEGAILVIVMLVLLLLTVMGRGAVTTSVTEMGISGNERLYKKTFYTAEAGFEHAKALLQTEFRQRNRARIASGQNPDWDFSLNGIVTGIQPATGLDFDGGAVWVRDTAFDDGSGLSGSYTVSVWNNPSDRGGITNDTDRLICVRSTARGPRGTTSSVEVLLLGQASGETIGGYSGQLGGGCNHVSRDVRAIADFSMR